VRSGKPCFVGTRIAVYDVLEYLASGKTADEIVADFPEFTAEHVWAAIEFAAQRELAVPPTGRGLYQRRPRRLLDREALSATRRFHDLAAPYPLPAPVR